MSYLMKAKERRAKRDLHLRTVRAHANLVDLLRDIRLFAVDLESDYRETGHDATAAAAKSLISKIPPGLVLKADRVVIEEVLRSFNALPEEID